MAMTTTAPTKVTKAVTREAVGGAARNAIELGRGTVQVGKKRQSNPRLRKAKN